jgi:hypothetical protein
MKIRVTLSPVVLAGAFLLTHAAHAKTISTKRKLSHPGPGQMRP